MKSMNVLCVGPFISARFRTYTQLMFCVFLSPLLPAEDQLLACARSVRTNPVLSQEDMASSARGHGKNLLGVVIEDNARIAGHVMKLPGVKIGKGAIVGAYSLVTKNVEPYTLVYGIPAEEQDDKHGLLKEEIHQV